MPFSDCRTAAFAFGEAEARAAALAWINRRWLASPALSRHARAGPIEALSLPFWLIDAHAILHWEAPALRGIVESDFVALPICAEPGADAVLMEAIEPWPPSALRPCAARDASVARGALTREDALVDARRRMERDLMATARRNQPSAVRAKMRLLGLECPREAAVPALLPVFRFDGVRLGRRWRVAVNGVTGRACAHADNGRR